MGVWMYGLFLLLKREHPNALQNWSFEIYLAASEDGNDLEVMRINLEYNHEICKDLYETLPRRSSLPAAGHVLEEVKSAIELKANNKFLP